jgi:tetratricopeptide (TPR) repeat protein
MKTSPRSLALVLAVPLAVLFVLPVAAPAADRVAAPAADDPAAALEQLDRALKEVQPAAAPPPRPAAKAPAPAPAQLGYFGLLPGRSSRADLELMLGDPVDARDERLAYAPPDGATDAERLEVVFLKETRVLQRLDVVLRAPLAYGELAARSGRRVLVEKGDEGRVWEYRVPSFMALGYQATAGGPPLVVERLRYVSPQYLADLFVARGKKAEGQKQLDDALTEFEKATRVDPAYALPYVRMGAIYEAKTDRAQALVHYTAATQAAYPSAAKASAHYRIGTIYVQDRQPELALTAFTRALGDDPTLASAQFQIGLTYHGLVKKPAEALAAYQKAVLLKPDHAAAHYNMGLLHADARDAKAAAAAFQKAVESNPTWDKGSHRLLAARLALDDFAGVEREARRRLEGQADDAVAMVHLAMALSSQLPERSAVVTFLSGLVNEDPRLKEALDWLDKAVAAGYAEKAVLEQSPHLRRVREQSPLVFKKVVARLDKPRG